ncbi:MAG TPA: hypothetical protein VGR15_08725 [Bacteroidota bacterium]|nr:hypothetical protein [Bacteroidota bacterium]
MIKQQPPLDLLYLPALLVQSAIPTQGFLTKVHKSKRIPPIAFRNIVYGVVVRVELLTLILEFKKDFMFANAAQPILTVGEVSFPAVHDGVPVASILCFDGLCDAVAFFEMIVQEP